MSRTSSLPILPVAIALVLAVTLLCASSVNAQDMGIPDSAYFLEPEITILDCQPTVQISLPVYLFSDGWCNTLDCRFGWEGNVICDTVLLDESMDSENLEVVGIVIDNDQHWVRIYLADYSPGVPVGAGVLFQILFHSGLAESLHTFTLEPPGFRLSNAFLESWGPPYGPLDSTFVISDTLALTPGDADCSGIANVSDCVYLIQYIFAGGPAPYDFNAADANQDCIANVTDAVYLIQYIFASGPDPLPGCVVP